MKKSMVLDEKDEQILELLRENEIICPKSKLGVGKFPIRAYIS